MGRKGVGEGREERDVVRVRRRVVRYIVFSFGGVVLKRFFVGGWKAERRGSAGSRIGLFWGERR